MLTIDILERVFHTPEGLDWPAVGPLKLDVPDGSFTCLIGPSGCGKSTTLRILLGLDQGFAGHVERPPDDRVGVVFQQPCLLPWRTVEQNVRLALPASRNGADLSVLFQALELQQMRHFYPAELSLGLARRVALARAFALEPELLVLDEPFVSLDEQTAERLRDLLGQLCDEHRTTTLMVTHNLREAARLADRIVVLSDRPARIVDCFTLDQPRAERNATSVERAMAPILAVMQGASGAVTGAGEETGDETGAV